VRYHDDRDALVTIQMANDAMISWEVRVSRLPVVHRPAAGRMIDERTRQGDALLLTAES